MYCYKCRYNLSNLGSARHCPECGAPFHPDRPATYRSSPGGKPGLKSSLPQPVPPWIIESIFGFLAGIVVTCGLANLFGSLRGRILHSFYGFSTVYEHEARFNLVMLAALIGLSVAVLVLHLKLAVRSSFPIGVITALAFAGLLFAGQLIF